MKGQYLALEAVLIMAIGVSIAVGAVNIFKGFNDRIFESGREVQTEVVEERILTGIQEISRADKARRSVDLPETVAGSDYSLVANGTEIFIITSDGTTTFRSGYRDFNITGEVRSEDASLIKSGNEIVLRPG